MNYVQRTHPGRRIAGLVVIVGLHAALFYGLTRGLERDKPLPSAPKPVETRIVQELRPPPPPPPAPKQVVPKPRLAPTPPLAVQPPEVQIAQAPIPEAITAPAIAAAPSAPQASVPSEASAYAPTSVVAAPAPVRTAQNAGVICPNSSEVRANTRYPEAAQKRNITGDVVVEFLVADSGAIDNIIVVGKPNRVLASAAIEATRQFKCLGQTPPARVQVSYSFQMN